MNDFASYDLDGVGPEYRQLVVFGSFTQINGQSFQRIAQWNGAVWSSLGSGTVGTAETGLEFDHDVVGSALSSLHLFGGLNIVNDMPVQHAARWDGSAWHALEGHNHGLNGNGWSVVTLDDDGSGPNPKSFYVAGTFSTAGGVIVNNVARCDGFTLHALGSPPFVGVDSGASCLAVKENDDDGPALYIGGVFSTAGSVPAHYIAKWQNNSWSALPSEVSGGVVYSLAFHDDDGPGPNPSELYAGGEFDMAGDLPVNRVARFDGKTWHALGAGFNSRVHALASFDPDDDGPALPDLYAGLADSPNLAKWSAGQWVNVAGFNNDVLVLHVHDDDGGPGTAALYAGGFFTQAGGIPAKVARFDGTSWSAVGSGTTGTVRSITFFDFDGNGPEQEKLVVGGSTLAPLGTPTWAIGVWNGSSWEALGTGITNSNLGVFGVDGFDPDASGPEPPILLAVGNFAKAGGLSSSNIAAWIGCSYCTADVDRSGAVNVLDLLAIIDAWGNCIDVNDCGADLTADDTVNVLDLLAVITAWGPCP